MAVSKISWRLLLSSASNRCKRAHSVQSSAMLFSLVLSVRDKSEAKDTDLSGAKETDLAGTPFEEVEEVRESSPFDLRSAWGESGALWSFAAKAPEVASERGRWTIVFSRDSSEPPLAVGSAGVSSDPSMRCTDLRISSWVVARGVDWR